ncbi:MAG: hypothetical protein ACTTKL_11155 [Treponema sp.]
METQTFIGLVEEMRRKQKEFSKTRRLTVYTQAQILEKEVDAAILQLKRNDEITIIQGKLF